MRQNIKFAKLDLDKRDKKHSSRVRVGLQQVKSLQDYCIPRFLNYRWEYYAKVTNHSLIVNEQPSKYLSWLIDQHIEMTIPQITVILTLHFGKKLAKLEAFRWRDVLVGRCCQVRHEPYRHYQYKQNILNSF